MALAPTLTLLSRRQRPVFGMAAQIGGDERARRDDLQPFRTNKFKRPFNQRIADPSPFSSTFESAKSLAATTLEFAILCAVHTATRSEKFARRSRGNT